MLRLTTAFRVFIVLSVCFISVTEHHVSQTVLAINLKRPFSFNLKKYLERRVVERREVRAAERTAEANIDDYHKAAIQTCTDYKLARIANGEDAFTFQLMYEYKMYNRRYLLRSLSDTEPELNEENLGVEMPLADVVLIREALLAGPSFMENFEGIKKRIEQLTIGGADLSGRNRYQNQISKLEQVNTQLNKYHSAILYVRHREARLRSGRFHLMHSLSDAALANAVADIELQRIKNEEQVRVDISRQPQIVTGMPVVNVMPVVTGMPVD